MAYLLKSMVVKVTDVLMNSVPKCDGKIKVNVGMRLLIAAANVAEINLMFKTLNSCILCTHSFVFFPYKSIHNFITKNHMGRQICNTGFHNTKERDNRESYGLSVTADATTPTWFDKNNRLLD